MFNMKKIFCLMLAALFLTGCGSTAPAETAAPASETEAERKTESDVSENAEAAPIPEEGSRENAE